jgi:hypothetical protein
MKTLVRIILAATGTFMSTGANAGGPMPFAIGALACAGKRSSRSHGAAPKSGQKQPSTRHYIWVPPAGFEPAAFCSGGRRSIP